MPKQTHAIVLWLDDGTTGIQTARILSRRGIPVVAIAKDPRHPCCRTNVCQRIVFPDADSQNLASDLERLGPSFDEKPVLFPCQDDTVLFVSIAFAGTGAPLGETILTTWVIKVAWEAAATPLTYGVVGYLKRAEGVDVYDTELRLLRPRSLA